MKASCLEPWKVLLVLLFVVTAGCGITGSTRTFTLRPGKSDPAPLAGQLRVATVTMEDNAAELVTAGVAPWGEFNRNDLAHLAQSLRNTVGAVAESEVKSGTPQLNIHVVVRRHVLAVSEASYSTLACIAWAAAESGGELIYHEEFYCAKKVYLVGTAGQMKDTVNKAVVRRIAERSALLARQAPATAVRQVQVENTYDALEEAVAHLPKKVTFSPAYAAFPTPFWLLAGPPTNVKVRWESFKPAGEFDWKKHLAGQTNLTR